MSRLTKEMRQDVEVLCRDGVSLHSGKNPEGEAREWAEAQSALLTRKALHGPVFVLGFGAGHHLRALAQLRPELRLIGVDFDTEILGLAADYNLILGFREALKAETKISVLIATEQHLNDSEKKDLFGMGYSVLRFRPAWAGFETEYTALEASLLDATPESVEAWYATAETKDQEELTEEQKLILALKEVVS